MLSCVNYLLDNLWSSKHMYVIRVREIGHRDGKHMGRSIVQWQSAREMSASCSDCMEKVKLHVCFSFLVRRQSSSPNIVSWCYMYTLRRSVNFRQKIYVTDNKWKQLFHLFFLYRRRHAHASNRCNTCRVLPAERSLVSSGLMFTVRLTWGLPTTAWSSWSVVCPLGLFT